jgi:hypothetical protein
VSLPRLPSPQISTVDPGTEESPLHVASAQDRTAAHSRDDLVSEILLSADERDAMGERRDRAAEARVPGDVVQAALDRVWAARDRDAAAVDRAALVALASARGAGRSVVQPQ